MEFIKRNKIILCILCALVLLVFVADKMYWKVPDRIIGYYPLGTGQEEIESDLKDLAYEIDYFPQRQEIFADAGGHPLTDNKGKVSFDYVFSENGKLSYISMNFFFHQNISEREQYYYFERIYRAGKKEWGRPEYKGTYEDEEIVVWYKGEQEAAIQMISGFKISFAVWIHHDYSWTERLRKEGYFH